MRFAKACVRSIQLWLCVTVYVWGLGFQAVVNTQEEPFFDRILDCTAVLLTMAFWAVVLASTLVLVFKLLRVSAAVAINTRLAMSTFVIGTAYYFAQWLNNWSFSETHPELITASFLMSCLPLSIWVLLYRKRRVNVAIASHLPPLKDCFWFGAFPILVCAAVLVGTRAMSFITPSPFASASSPIKWVSATKTPGLERKPNVILIILDALRAQDMSLYGYDRQTTPSLEDFANHSTVYEQAHTNSTSTQVSITTLLSGKRPSTHGRLTKFQSPYGSAENLFRILKDNHYLTSAIVSNWDASTYTLGFSPWLVQPEISNFDLPGLHNLEKYGVRKTKAGERMYIGVFPLLNLFGIPQSVSSYGTAGTTLGLAISELPTVKQPFFLYIHLHEPHDPYVSPPPFSERYFSEKDRWLRKTQPKPAIYARYPPKYQSVVETYRDEYDDAISFADFEIGKFLKSLQQFPWWGNTLVIITSDHGESFERGYFGHGEELYESSTHVPLMIRWPGQENGRRISGQVQSIDIAPTILQASGISIPKWMEGQPLIPTRSPKSSYTMTVNFKVPLSKTIDVLPTKLAIWREPYKAIFSCDTNQAELYNLSTDPGEKINTGTQNPTILKELKDNLRAALSNATARNLLPCVENEPK